MKTTIDSAGRIVIPRDIRVLAHLERGSIVEIEVRDGVVSIEPASAPVKIVGRGKLRVATVGSRQLLTEGVVRGVRDETRRKR